MANLSNPHAAVSNLVTLTPYIYTYLSFVVKTKVVLLSHGFPIGRSAQFWDRVLWWPQALVWASILVSQFVGQVIEPLGSLVPYGVTFADPMGSIGFRPRDSFEFTAAETKSNQKMGELHALFKFVSKQVVLCLCCFLGYSCKVFQLKKKVIFGKGFSN